MATVQVAAADGTQTAPHLLPCEIMHSGPAAVSAYFRPRPRDGEAGMLEVEFRGRALRGQKLALPAGYEGSVLQDTVAASIADGEQRTWKQTAAFKDLIYWKHDDPPMDADPLQQAVQWAEIAGVLHGETNPEETADGGDLNRGPSAEL